MLGETVRVLVLAVALVVLPGLLWHGIASLFGG
jgi:hypothetical protein